MVVPHAVMKSAAYLAVLGTCALSVVACSADDDNAEVLAATHAPMATETIAQHYDDDELSYGTQKVEQPTQPKVLESAPMESHGVDVEDGNSAPQTTLVSVDSDPLESKYAKGVIAVVNVTPLDKGEALSQRDIDAIINLVNGANKPTTEKGRIEYFRKNMCSPILRATEPDMWDVKGYGDDPNNAIELEKVSDTKVKGNIATAKGSFYDVEAKERYEADMAFMFENDRWTYCTN